MTLAWVTPVDPPGEVKCLKVYYPSGVEYEACLRGALLSLTEVENWEQINGQDVEVVAAAFFAAYQVTLEWRSCMPIGTVHWFAGSTLPDGFLWCDGASYPTVAQYTALHQVIGYDFGGFGPTFNVPNLVDRFVYGIAGGSGLADTGGESTHALTVSEMPSHRHSIPGKQTILMDVPIGVITVDSPDLINDHTSYEGGGEAHENKPPYIKMRAIIRYQL